MNANMRKLERKIDKIMDDKIIFQHLYFQYGENGSAGGVAPPKKPSSTGRANSPSEPLIDS